MHSPGVQKRDRFRIYGQISMVEVIGDERSLKMFRMWIKKHQDLLDSSCTRVFLVDIGTYEKVY
jgi:hypothetical protein